MSSVPATDRQARVRGELRMVGAFVAVGAVVAATNLATYAAMLAAGLPYPVAAVVGFLVSTVVSYTGNRRFTFVDAPPPTGAQMGRFLLVQLTGLGVNLAVLTLGVQAAGLHELPAEVVASAVQSTFTFLANRLWTFRAPPG